MRRAATASLWFLSVWCAYETVIYFTGGPRAAGPIIAAIAGLLVYVDPARLIWARTPGSGEDTRTGGALRTAPRLEV